MLWNYGIKEVEVVVEVTGRHLVHWLIKVEGCLHWVIRQQCKNVIPLIANEMKGYFKLEQSQMILCRVRGCLYTLIKSFDPNLYPEITLREYSKDCSITDDIILQSQKIFAFRKLLGLTKIDDSSIIVRKRGLIPVLISIHETTNFKENAIPEATLNKWFRCNDTSLSRATERLLGVKYPRAITQHEIDRFTDQIQPILDRLEYIINFFNPDLIWIHSDVSKYLTLNNSPYVRY